MQFTVHKGSGGDLNQEKWFEELYHTNVERLIRYAYSMTENRSLAEDVVAEVFIVFWNKKEELYHVNDQPAYLARSVRNLAIKKVSQCYKEQTLGPGEESQQQHGLDPESILIGKELEGVIREVVENLTPHGRLVYDMARNKGYSNEKIARELGISKLTVSKHLGNVLKAFKMALRKHYRDAKGNYPMAKLISVFIAFSSFFLWQVRIQLENHLV